MPVASKEAEEEGVAPPAGSDTDATAEVVGPPSPPEAVGVKLAGGECEDVAVPLALLTRGGEALLLAVGGKGEGVAEAPPLLLALGEAERWGVPLRLPLALGEKEREGSGEDESGGERVGEREESGDTEARAEGEGDGEMRGEAVAEAQGEGCSEGSVVALPPPPAPPPLREAAAVALALPVGEPSRDAGGEGEVVKEGGGARDAPALPVGAPAVGEVEALPPAPPEEGDGGCECSDEVEPQRAGVADPSGVPEALTDGGEEGGGEEETPPLAEALAVAVAHSVGAGVRDPPPTVAVGPPPEGEGVTVAPPSLRLGDGVGASEGAASLEAAGDAELRSEPLAQAEAAEEGEGGPPEEVPLPLPPPREALPL